MNYNNNYCCLKTMGPTQRKFISKVLNGMAELVEKDGLKSQVDLISAMHAPIFESIAKGTAIDFSAYCRLLNCLYIRSGSSPCDFIEKMIRFRKNRTGLSGPVSLIWLDSDEKFYIRLAVDHCAVCSPILFKVLNRISNVLGSIDKGSPVTKNDILFSTHCLKLFRERSAQKLRQTGTIWGDIDKMDALIDRLRSVLDVMTENGWE